MSCHYSRTHDTVANLTFLRPLLGKWAVCLWCWLSWELSFGVGKHGRAGVFRSVETAHSLRTQGHPVQDLLCGTNGALRAGCAGLIFKFPSYRMEFLWGWLVGSGTFPHQFFPIVTPGTQRPSLKDKVAVTGSNCATPPPQALILLSRIFWEVQWPEKKWVQQLVTENLTVTHN